MARPNPAEGILVRGWQHKTEAHIRGCPASQYYIASCSDACIRAKRLVGKLTKEEISQLPVDSPSRGSTAQDYG